MGKEIATIETQASTFLKSIQSMLPSYAHRTYRMESFVKSAMIAIVSSQELQRCLTTDAGKASMINALRAGAGSGLSLNPQEGKAALIAYNMTASYQIMKNGMIELALESEQVEFIIAETIKENDEFSISKSMDGDKYNFTPHRKDRGAVDGFFSAMKMKNGTTHCKYMTFLEVEEHRDKYAKGLTDKNNNQKPNHVWNKSFNEMGEKTILKKLLRTVHINHVIDRAVGGDDWEHEIKDVTPKGFSADDLTAKLETQRPNPHLSGAPAQDVEPVQIQQAEPQEQSPGENQVPIEVSDDSESVI